MGGARGGRKVGSGTAGGLCQSLVLSGCRRNGSPRGCLGESAESRLGVVVPGAGGVRGAVIYNSQQAGKEAMLFKVAYGEDLGLERQDWAV